MLRKDREYFVQGCKVHQAETTEALTKRSILLPRDQQDSRRDVACLFEEVHDEKQTFTATFVLRQGYMERV